MDKTQAVEVGDWVVNEACQHAVGQIQEVQQETGAVLVAGGRWWPRKDVARISERLARDLVQLARLTGLPMRDDGTLPLDPRAVGVTPNSLAGQTFDVPHATGTQNVMVGVSADVISAPPEAVYLQELAERVYADAVVMVFVDRVVVYRPLAHQDQIDVVKVAPVLDIVGPKAVDGMDAALRTLAGEPPGAGAALGLLGHWEDIRTRGGLPRRGKEYIAALEACSRDVERAFDLPGPPDGLTAKHDAPGAAAAREVLESFWAVMQVADPAVVHEEWFKAMMHCYEMVRIAFGLPPPPAPLPEGRT